MANLDKKKKIKNVNLARLCARLKPVFLSKKGPSKARLLTKMSSSEELGTLPKIGSNFEEEKTGRWIYDTVSDVVKSNGQFAGKIPTPNRIH